MIWRIPPPLNPKLDLSMLIVGRGEELYEFEKKSPHPVKYNFNNFAITLIQDSVSIKATVALGTQVWNPHRPC